MTPLEANRMSLFGNPFRDLGDGFYFQLSLYICNGEAGLASVHKDLRLRDLCKELGFFVRARIIALGAGSAS